MITNEHVSECCPLSPRQAYIGGTNTTLGGSFGPPISPLSFETRVLPITAHIWYKKANPSKLSSLAGAEPQSVIALKNVTEYDE